MSGCEGTDGPAAGTATIQGLAAPTLIRRIAAAVLTVLAVALCTEAVPAQPASADAIANRLFVEAMSDIRLADETYDLGEQAERLRRAERSLRDIIERTPESGLAVQLATGQFIGDFDPIDFRQRLRALACNEPRSTACFLYRIELFLSPIEFPILVARWDWLSLAIAHRHIGDATRTRPIIAPFHTVQRRGLVPSTDEDLYVARALALTGELELAEPIARSMHGCAARAYNFVDIAAGWMRKGERDRAVALVNELERFVRDNRCSAELALVAQARSKVAQSDEGRAIMLQVLDEQFARPREQGALCCTPELAVAVAELGDVHVALRVLRRVPDEGAWAIPTVVGRIAGRGEHGLAIAYAEQVDDLDLRAESLAEIIHATVRRRDAGPSQEAYQRLVRLTGGRGVALQRPVALAQRAKADRLLQADDRWRDTFLEALDAADQTQAFGPRDIAAPLLAALVQIETGEDLLN